MNHAVGEVDLARSSRWRHRHVRFLQWLSRSNAAPQIALLAFLMSLPAVTMGLVADDYELALAATRDPWSAYTFYDDQRVVLDARAEGSAPWWIDPELRQRFLRPLSSLSLALDFRLLPDTALPLHVENPALYALIVLIVAALYRALDLPAAHLGLATFFFAMQAAQSMTVGWISGRSTLLATLFGLWSVQLYVSCLRTGRAWRALAASAALALALASAEAGIAAAGYMFAFGWVEGAVRSADPQRTLRNRGARLRLMAGPALVALIWQVVYRAGG